MGYTRQQQRTVLLQLSIINLLSQFLWWGAAGAYHTWNELFLRRTSLSGTGTGGAGFCPPSLTWGLGVATAVAALASLMWKCVSIKTEQVSVVVPVPKTRYK